MCGILAGVTKIGTALLVALCAIPAYGNSFTFITTNGMAVITTSNGFITLTLTDTAVNPAADTANLSAFSFTTSVLPGAESISSGGTAISRTINGKGAGQYTDSSTPVAAGWVLSVNSATTKLDVLAGTGHLGPSHTILGAPDANNAYSAANGSLTGGTHNPYLLNSVTWVIAAANVTSLTTITTTTFQFGTADGVGTVVVATPTPEPGSIALVLGGIAVISVFRRRLSRKSE